MLLGLKHNTNYLVDYDPDWPIAFEEERLRCRARLDRRVLAYRHEQDRSEDAAVRNYAFGSDGILRKR